MTTRHEDIQVQYLGASGYTRPCIQAMVTILTSPFPCHSISVLYSKKTSTDSFYSACFVVWNWLDYEQATIIPDAFGTYRGEGGWGLELVLELIEFYHIPFIEKFIEAEQFARVSSGFPTDDDLVELRQPEYGPQDSQSHWNDYQLNFWKTLLIKGSSWRFPHWVIEPELVKDVEDVENHPTDAAFRAVRRLEVFIRGLGSYEPSLIGIDLVSKAMGNSGEYIPQGETESEKQAWVSIFRGVIGAFKNPQSHRDVKLSREDAFNQILVVNMLVQKLKGDFPDKFHKPAKSQP